MAMLLLVGSLLNLIVGLTAIIMGVQNLFAAGHRRRGIVSIVVGIVICLLTLALFGQVF